MNKYTIPIIITVLGVVFSVICFMVYVSKGKSAYWINKKLKIGALILTLTAILSCDGTKSNGGDVTCYAMPASNSVLINEVNETGIISFEKSDNFELSGTIYNRDTSTFSFVVIDSLNTVFQKEDIIAKDGIFNQNQEEFKLSIKKTIPSGKYILKLFPVLKDNIDSAQYYISHYKLEIK